MITSSDPKSNAMLVVIQAQRDSALEGVAMMAGDLAEARAALEAEKQKSAGLQSRLDVLTPKEVTT
jgi:hypothetical protein